ncbi:MAG: exodeoxyribonuclease V subunit beta [Methylococcales bacterium]
MTEITDARSLELNNIPLTGRNLIEASAGTGKTYTIAALYTRLIIEQDLDVSKILVMTFTNAATEELRARLRKALVDALQAISTDEIPTDSFLKQIRDQTTTSTKQTAKTTKKLRLAICSFDQASVYTIHGFCQRLLKDVALEAGVAFDNEIVRDDSELRQQIVDDFWRKQFYIATNHQLDQLASAKLTPETLANSVAKWVSKPYLNVLPLQLDSACEAIETDLQTALDKARTVWGKSSEDIKKLLIEDEGLKRNSYKIETLPDKLHELETLVNTTSSGLLSKDEMKCAQLFTASVLKEKTKKNHQTPHHAFFDVWEAYKTLTLQHQICNQQAINQIRLQLLEHLRISLKQIKHEQGILSYDDLLLRLHEALTSESDSTLARQISKRFPVALIDEFQDTDPVQYEIFDSIYHQSNQSAQALFLVGDPKQAIYSFRGADIYTYLRARNTAQKPWWTLTQNWRSSQRMVTAINILFQHNQRPFWLDTINYQIVEAAQGEALNAHFPDELPALRCWVVENKNQPNKLLAKTNAEPLIVDAVADEIAVLLNRGVAGQFKIDTHAVCGGDIAVLVRTNRQGESIRQALTARGIASVLLTHDSVFNTLEAQDLAHVITAILQPTRHGLICAALATRILGLNAQQIASFENDDALAQQKWDQWLDTFRDWHQLWLKHGFMRMFKAIIEAGDCYRRWLVLPDGERRITNLLHLGELLNQQNGNNALGLQGLLNWLNRQRDSEDEEAVLRLESDENLVKIVTIHASKGLEYNLVFCPFLWDGKQSSTESDNGEPFVYHDTEQNHIACLDMGSDQREYGKKLAVNEALAEELRLLYVALTRAKYHCTIVTGQINGIEKSALGWLLYGNHQLTTIAETTNAIKNLSVTDKLKILDSIVSKTNGAMQHLSLPQPVFVSFKPATKQNKPRKPRKPRQFSGTIAFPQQVVSFTLLTHGVDHQQLDDDQSIVSQEIPQAASEFPRGSQAGTCLHKMLEDLDFTKPVLDQQTIIKDALRANYSADQQQHLTQLVTPWLQQVLDTPLQADNQFCLRQLAVKDRIDEFGFYYPIENLNIQSIKKLLIDYYPDSIINSAINRLTSRNIQGWMRGFIDLVYRQNDCYYLADYKSNWLGVDQQAYHADNLIHTIANQHYYLQYLIYSVALHRFLQLRLVDYDYQRHFGGVYYLFLRGMSPQAAPGTGIYYDKPAQPLIETLSQLFSNSQAA